MSHVWREILDRNQQEMSLKPSCVFVIALVAELVKLHQNVRSSQALTGGTGVGVLFHNSIIGTFMMYQDRLETNLLQLFAHTENSE